MGGSSQLLGSRGREYTSWGRRSHSAVASLPRRGLGYGARHRARRSAAVWEGKMRSGNPVLTSKTFEIAPAGERMTLGGTVNKTAILLALCLITAIYTWGRFYSTGNAADIMPLVWTGAIGGFVVCLVTV